MMSITEFLNADCRSSSLSPSEVPCPSNLVLVSAFLVRSREHFESADADDACASRDILPETKWPGLIADKITPSATVSNLFWMRFALGHSFRNTSRVGSDFERRSEGTAGE